MVGGSVLTEAVQRLHHSGDAVPFQGPGGLHAHTAEPGDHRHTEGSGGSAAHAPSDFTMSHSVVNCVRPVENFLSAVRTNFL